VNQAADDVLRRIKEEYGAALMSYLHGGGETALTASYDLGRQALEKGLGVLDIAATHREALMGLVGAGAGAVSGETLGRAFLFFKECLSPFEMASRGFKEANDELQKLNRDLEKRVADRTADLKASNEELESFSYTISHDLRGPLTGIVRLCEVMLTDYGEKLDDRGRTYLRLVGESSQWMGDLIADLLSLSRAGRLKLERHVIDLSEIAGQLIAEFRRTAPQRQVEVVIMDGLRADGDAVLVRLVLQNLLGNAWKFTSKKEAARIEFGRIADKKPAIFFVRDNGAGFDEEFLPRLFEPFQRFHSSEDYPGTGIGLATVKRIVHRHGGQVWAEGAPGQGATFYFML